ncbi:major facilitator superfamily transporter [Rhypophila decipiens]
MSHSQQQRSINPGAGGASGSGSQPDTQQRGASSATPSSSAQTSDRMTPDSDSDDDSDNVAVPRAENKAYGLEHGDDNMEMYELQDGSRIQHDRGLFPDKYSHQEGDGYRESEEYDDTDVEGAAAADGYYHDAERAGQRRRRTASVASFQLYTPDEEKAVVRKFDRKLVVFVALLYMLSFLDRSNIGNARIAGMDDDLQSVPPKKDYYEWALAAFYMAYIAFEWMSLLWRLIPAHIYVSVLVLSWGLTASMQAVAVNYPMLIFLRTLLGIGEAGFTGIPFYLSFFFKRDELAFRTAIFVSAAPLATSFASSLAWLIIKLGQHSPVAPWRLLFLIEGFPSVLVALIAWNIIPDSPQTAPYLTAREKKVARLRLRQEKSTKKSKSSSSGLNIHDLLSVLVDPIAWLTALIFFLTNMAYSSLPVFLPTILTAMGHDTLTSQALAAPPYLASFLIVLATAYISDKTRSRTIFLVIHALASCGGYTLLAFSQRLGLESASLWRYFAVYPAAIGFFNVVVLTIVWSINNQRGESRQGGGFALMQLVGQCGPLVGVRLYPDSEGPFWSRGMAVCAVAMGVVALLAGGLRVYLGWLNQRLEREEFGEGPKLKKVVVVGGLRRQGGGDEEIIEEGEEEAEGLVGGHGRRGGRRRGSDELVGGTGEGRGGFRYML